jgi:hypothetical protein
MSNTGENSGTRTRNPNDQQNNDQQKNDQQKQGQGSGTGQQNQGGREGSGQQTGGSGGKNPDMNRKEGSKP